MDIYREICCALGSLTGHSDYVAEVRGSGSTVGPEALGHVYRGMRSVPFHVHVVPCIRFLHFGTLRDLIESGRALMGSDKARLEKGASVVIDSLIGARGSILGKNSWIEGCRVEAPLTLAGKNVIVGVDISTPLALPRGGSLDILPGRGQGGERGWFVRAYSIDDAFHLRAGAGARLCGLTGHGLA